MKSNSFIKRQLKEIQKILRAGYWEYYFNDETMLWSDEIYHILDEGPDKVIPSLENLYERIHPDDLTLVKNAIGKIKIDQKDSELVFRLLHKSGKQIFVNHTLEYKFDKNENVAYIVGIFTDVTDRIFYQKARDELQQKYMLTAKLTSLGRIANSIAHKINNPLMVVSGSIQLLRKHIIDCPHKSPNITKYVDTVAISLDRITKIISGLRSYADAGIDGDEIFDVNKVIHKTNSFAEVIKLAPDINLSISLAPEKLMVYGNVGKFQQVILNIYSNAVDALTGKKDKFISLTTWRNQDHICIKIVDNGHGIGRDKVHRVFDSFYTTKELSASIGVGLSIARNIIDGMGGEISLDSKPNEGTAVLICIPSYN